MALERTPISTPISKVFIVISLCRYHGFTITLRSLRHDVDMCWAVTLTCIDGGTDASAVHV